MTPAESRAFAREFAELPLEQRRLALRALGPEQRRAVLYAWVFRARPDQLPPLPGEPGDDWRSFLMLAGRGAGKTRAAAEYVQLAVENSWAGRIHLIAPTAADGRDVMVEGESGLLSVAAPGWRASYEPSKRRLTWQNGAQATVFSADEPDRLRGPQADLAWGDELAAWKYPDDAWHNMQLGLRLGKSPRGVFTTTPRPIKIVKDLIADPTTHVTRSSTYANRANLPPAFLAYIRERYEGTRLGRQEIYAEVLTDTPGALWSRDVIESARVPTAPASFARIVIGIDPAVTSHADSDETGIVVVGLADDRHAYVLEDASGRHTPSQWAAIAVRLYREYRADLIVGEVNNGGDLVGANVRTADPTVAFKSVVASRGKAKRMEPVAALYEQGKVHHVGSFPALEDQMTTWSPSESRFSPDRVDSLTWTCAELMLGAGEPDFTSDTEFSLGDRRMSTVTNKASDGW